MEHDDDVRHTVRNDQRQPVELHLPSGVLVLLPGEAAELSEADLAAPQLQVLRSCRLITTQRSAVSGFDAASNKGGDETAEHSSGTATPHPEATRRGTTNQ